MKEDQNIKNVETSSSRDTRIDTIQCDILLYSKHQQNFSFHSEATTTIWEIT